MVGGFMSITMKGGVHENLHQTLNDCQKFEKIRDECQPSWSGACRSGQRTNPQLRGFIISIMKGFITHELIWSVAPCWGVEHGDECSITPGQRVHHFHHEPPSSPSSSQPSPSMSGRARRN